MKYILEYEEWQEAELNEMNLDLEELMYTLILASLATMSIYVILRGIFGNRNLSYIKRVEQKYLTKDDRKIVKKILKNDPQCKLIKKEVKYYVKEFNKIIAKREIRSTEQLNAELKHNKVLYSLYTKIEELNDKLFKRMYELVDDELKYKLDEMRKELNDNGIKKP